MKMTSDNFFKIKIEGKQFYSAYLVYVIKIIAPEATYFYVGQTGDRHYISARPAFRRLAAHFSDQGYATDNQVYRQLAYKVLKLENADKRGTFDNNIKQEVTKFLSYCEIEMFVHPISVFCNDSTHEKHIQEREITEKIEEQLIWHLVKKHGGEYILNKKQKEVYKIEELTLDIIKHIEE